MYHHPVFRAGDIQHHSTYQVGFKGLFKVTINKNSYLSKLLSTCLNSNQEPKVILDHSLWSRWVDMTTPSVLAKSRRTIERPSGRTLAIDLATEETTKAARTRRLLLSMVDVRVSVRVWAANISESGTPSQTMLDVGAASVKSLGLGTLRVDVENDRSVGLFIDAGVDIEN